MNLEKIVKYTKTAVITGAVSYSLFSGAKYGVSEYMKWIDRPTPLAHQEITIERLSDGRIHVYQLTEKHDYLPPPELQRMVPQQPAPEAKPNTYRDLENAPKLAMKVVTP